MTKTDVQGMRQDEASIPEEEIPIEDDSQKEKVDTVSPQNEELNTKYLRLAADFQNFRKRTEKEKSDIYAYANEKLTGELLDVIDNFERALQISEEEKNSFVTGIEMIFKQFKTVLEKSGLEEIEAAGTDFDPNYHHAVMTAAEDGFESGKIIEVFKKGYMLNKKVIRPSMVKVAE
ncbi:MAG: nucleotide exchange factor GrpE [Eubacteriales bacterium]|nr:nucleotide exchange factor GrpE [Eubacteriales bacterium]MDD4389941.1 nucleotide exchange factor GrpE [Eubacteriales bacterium]